MSQVTDAESRKDYQTAVNLLRQLVGANVDNPEIHHRLAVNLMAHGDIADAVSEFRIASALSPGKKEYSEDLARAMAIHKRSLMSDAGQDSSTSTGAAAGAK